MTTKKKTINIEGMKRNEALTALIREGMDFSDAEEYWKEHGAKKKGFRALFYEECLKRSFDNLAFDKFCDDNEASDNVRNLRNYYLNISDLVERAKEVGRAEK